MGELHLHNLGEYITKFNLKSFVETGTGRGVGLKYALGFPFENLFSIEIIEDLYQKVFREIQDDRLTIYNENSIDGLKRVLYVLGETPCLFWLDAHFPGADFHYNDYEHLKENRELHKPLQAEVELLSKSRDTSKDVFIIDDLQIYEDGPFQLKNNEFRAKYGENGIGFINDAFESSHDFKRDYRHQGFLILTPKELS